MKYAMYSRFNSFLNQYGAEITADYMESLGLSYAETLEATPLPTAIPTVEYAKELKSAFGARGISFACASAFANILVPGTIDGLYKKVEIAAALGSPFFHHTFIPHIVMQEGLPSIDEGIEMSVEAAVKVARFARTLGVTCIYEEQGLYINGLENFGRFFYEVKRVCDDVGVIGDSGNSLFVGVEPDVFFKTYAKDVKHVHIKDYLRVKSDTRPGETWLPTESGKSGTWVRDAIVGDGVVDFEKCIAALKEVGYDGVYSFELTHPEPFGDGVKKAEQIIERYI